MKAIRNILWKTAGLDWAAEFATVKYVYWNKKNKNCNLRYFNTNRFPEKINNQKLKVINQAIFELWVNKLPA